MDPGIPLSVPEFQTQGDVGPAEFHRLAEMATFCSGKNSRDLLAEKANLAYTREAISMEQWTHIYDLLYGS